MGDHIDRPVPKVRSGQVEHRGHGQGAQPGDSRCEWLRGPARRIWRRLRSCDEGGDASARKGGQLDLGPGCRVRRHHADRELFAVHDQVNHPRRPASKIGARHSVGVPTGQLAHEYEDSVLAAPRFYEAGGREERFASSAPGLASDYQKLTAELPTRLQASTMAVTA